MTDELTEKQNDPANTQQLSYKNELRIEKMNIADVRRVLGNVTFERNLLQHNNTAFKK